MSALRPLRAAILELLQLRRRAGLHALSQVLHATQMPRAMLCSVRFSIMHAISAILKGYLQCAEHSWQMVEHHLCLPYNISFPCQAQSGPKRAACDLTCFARHVKCACQTWMRSALDCLLGADTCLPAGGVGEYCGGQRKAVRGHHRRQGCHEDRARCVGPHTRAHRCGAEGLAAGGGGLGVCCVGGPVLTALAQE